ncbi:MAG: hypothetical protein BWY69_00891 [Planctomycetes bacterium ADurb.Bin401]|nr:MAG: hypothetical protein BWY69_00891 [Planctomycetes bacterium ADurb.Bin401]
MDSWVVWIFELLGDENFFVVCGHLLGFLDSARNAVFCGSEDELSAERLDKFFSFFAHIFGHNDNDFISFEPSDQSDSDAGVAACGFDNDGIGFEPAVAFSAFEHGKRDAVFDASSGVEKFGLCVDTFAFEPDKRRISY